MSCNNCDSGMGAGLTFLSVIIGMIICGFVFLGSCAIIMEHLTDDAKPQQVRQQEVKVY